MDIPIFVSVPIVLVALMIIFFINRQTPPNTKVVQTTRPIAVIQRAFDEVDLINDVYDNVFNKGSPLLGGYVSPGFMSRQQEFPIL
jgi:hypothetical protein